MLYHMDEILWVGLFLLTILISVGKCYFTNCYDSFQVNRTCLFQEGIRLARIASLT